MMNLQYKSLTKKYRPTNFNNLYGQEILVQTLNNAIVNQQIVSSYLLTGMHGVGKTSAARIIAKTINCQNRYKEQNYIQSCNVCNSCKSFDDDKNPDILEIDAASKTSVDDIRQIIESSEYKPLISKYKIFIIDEVHMLSKGAFNALLKTLEEPPNHIIFILATTEVNKVPFTILSRCQRYDLKKIHLTEIINLLNFVKNQESINIDDEALKIISIKSKGSARDALSLLDQAISFSNKSYIDSTIIIQMLGLVDITSLIQLIYYIIKNDLAAINLFNSIYESAQDIVITLEDISELLAYMCKIKILKDYKHSIYDKYINDIKAIIENISLETLSIIWQIFYDGIQQIKLSNYQRTASEMLIIKAMLGTELPDMNSLLKIPDNIDNNFLCNTKIEYNNSNKIDSDTIDLIVKFIQYIYEKNEFDLYNILINNTELKEFTNNRLILNISDINQSLITRITLLVQECFQSKITIQINNNAISTSLKKQLMSIFEENKAWKLIYKNFPDAILNDITFQK